MHTANSFVTLTYDDDHLPANGDLNYPDYQLFMRRLRKAGLKARFFMVGEYGGITQRPHYHALLFGQNFAHDRKVVRMNQHQHPLYTSETLQRLWPLGSSELGELTFESAAYCSRYCLKKITGEPADLHYRRLSDGGELVQVQPEFARMSLKPGIGRSWFEKWGEDLERGDKAFIYDRAYKTPRYFDDLRRLKDAERFEETEFERYMRSQDYIGENTPERLAVRAAVAVAKSKLNNRTLHNETPNRSYP